VRIQFPQRVSIPKVASAAAVLFCVQQLEHTHLAFSLMFFAFVILSAVAFNAAGGFSRVIGAYIFWFATLIAIVGVTLKAVLREPADSNLTEPLLCISAYTMSMVMLLLVVELNKKFDLRPFAFAVAAGSATLNYTVVGLGCLAASIAIKVLDIVVGAAPGGLLAILNQLDVFLPLAIIFGTIGAIRESGGRRALNFPSALGIAITFGFGVLGFSKQAMLTPVVCWAVGAAFMRLNLRRVHIVVLVVFTAFAFKIVPTWAGGRDQIPEDATWEDRFNSVIFFATHFEVLQQAQADAEALDKSFGATGYFNDHQGLFDRLTIIAADDTMFAYTAKGHYYGYSPIAGDFENWAPHFLIPDKPGIVSGNIYEHELGGLAADDYSTGISFSPVAEAYHIDGWTGIFLLMPAIWILLFQSIDFIAGDLRTSPWGLLLVVYFAHAAPESLLSGLIYYTGYGNLSMVFAIVFCTRFAPIVGSLFAGRPKAASPETMMLRLPQPAVK
jgi:hypothetical protein